MADVVLLPATVFAQNWILTCTRCRTSLWHPGECPHIDADRQGDEFVACPNCRRLHYAIGGTFERPDVPTPLGRVQYSQQTDADGHVAVLPSYEMESSITVYLIRAWLTNNVPQPNEAPVWCVQDISQDRNSYGPPVADGLTLAEAIELAQRRCAKDDSWMHDAEPDDVEPMNGDGTEEARRAAEETNNLGMNDKDGDTECPS